MGPGIMDDQQVAPLQGGHGTVHGELVTVLAQGPGHVHRLRTGGVLLSGGGDVVVGPVNGGAHQVGGAGVHTHILLVNVLKMQHLGHQASVGPGHEPAQLTAELHALHTGGN